VVNRDVEVLAVEWNLPGRATQLTRPFDSDRSHSRNFDGLRVFARNRFLTSRGIVSRCCFSSTHTFFQRLDYRFRIACNFTLRFFSLHRREHLIVA
jgi:hypothetical protein